MKFDIRKLLGGIIIVIVLAFLFFRSDQLAQLAETVQKGAIVPVVIAIVTQLTKYFFQSFAYTSAFKAIGESYKFLSSALLVFGTFFMNTIAPSLNMAGTSLVIDEARRRGIAAGKATSAAILMQMSVESGFMVIMFLGFAILAVFGLLDPAWLALGLIVVALVLVMLTLLSLGTRKPKLLRKIFGFATKLANKVRAKFNKKPLSAWEDKMVSSLAEAWTLIKKNPKHTAKVFGYSALASACELSCFCLVGLAFGVTNIQALISGYVLATLFAMISITPQGVGVVEAVVALSFSAFGVLPTTGVAIALVYRGLVFWMPFLIGAIVIQKAKFFSKKKTSQETDDSGIGASDEEHINSPENYRP